MVRGGALAILLSAIAPQAGAKCAMPRAFFLPDTGSSMPASATVYLFVPQPGTPPTVIAQADGKDLPLKVDSLPAPTAFSVTRVRFDATGHTTVELAVKPEPGAPAAHRRDVAYRIDPHWKRRGAGTTQIAKVEEECHRWTCSYQETQNLDVTEPAPAYRVEWAHVRADYVAGRRQSIVLPRRMEHFFAWPGGSPVPAGGRLELGHVDCLGSAFEWAVPRLWVGVAALHADGAEGTPATTPTMVYRPRPSVLDRLRDLVTR